MDHKIGFKLSLGQNQKICWPFIMSFIDFGDFCPNFKVLAEFLILTKSHFKTSFVIHGYISLSGLISFLIVQSFQNSGHPNVDVLSKF